MKIYGERLSRAERVLWAADECGLQYEHIPVPVSGERTEALLAINPDGAIPTLDDDGLVLTQSWAINLYLARKYGGDLASRDAQEEANILRWTFWAACDVEAAILDTILATGMIPDTDYDPGRITKNEAVLQRPIAAINRWLEDNKYVVGSRFTIGDLNAVSIVSWLALTGFNFDNFEATKAWIDRCTQRPLFPKRG
jgi:glutathione S-transferase